MDFDKSISREKPVAKFSNGGTVFCVFAILATLVLICEFPRFLSKIIYGSLGIYAFSLFVLMFTLGLGVKFRRAFKMRRRYLLLGSIALFALFTSVHLAFTHGDINASGDFAKYLGYVFENQTPGGVLFAVPSFVIYTLCQLEGSFIVLGVMFIISAAFIATDIVTAVGEEAVVTKVEGSFELKPEPKKQVEITDYKSKTKELESKVEAKYQEILTRQSRKKLDKSKSELGLTDPPYVSPTRAIYDNPVPLQNLQPDGMNAPEQITQWSTEAAQKFNEGLGIPDFLPSQRAEQATSHSTGQLGSTTQYTPGQPAHAFGASQGFTPYPQTQQYTAPTGVFGQSAQNYQTQFVQGQTQQPFSTQSNFSQTPISNFPQPQAYPSAFGEQQATSDMNISDLRISRRLEQARSRIGRGNESIDDRINARGEQMKMEVAAKPKVYRPKKYIKPTIDMIRTESSNLSEFHIEAMEKQKMLDEKLQEFGVNAKVTSFTVAPAVTRFEIQLASGVRVAQVEQLQKDISYVLGSTQVRLELIEGKNAIGVEVPNKKVGIVSIKDLLASREFMQHKSPLAVAIGKNISDEIVVGDISTMPHLLIAGSTGSGKSVCLNTILTSLLFRSHPDEVKLLLVDMKRVELNMYNEVPHMLIPRAIKEVQQAINALKWMQTEMTRRYDLLEKNGVNNIGLYHSLPAYQQGTLDRMPYIIMVIDEAADLIARGKKEVEESIKSLSSLARACGIHIILATQRPSVDVITSVIKTNFTVRIAFKVSSRGDSVTIINNSGAEKLVGRGDMLYVKESFATRVQGAYIELEETRRVMNFIRENNEAEFETELEDIILNGPPVENAATGFGDADGIRGAGGRGGQDPLFVQVLKWLVRDDNLQRIASISGFQRQFGIGFARAGKIIDQLADAGYVSQGAGTKARQVLVSREDVEQIYGME